MRKLTPLALIVLLLTLGLSSLQAQDQNIVEIAAGNEDFSTLVTAVEAAGLVDVLADPEAEWTVFAPTNAAFDALPEGLLDTLLADTELLTRVLTYHVVQGSVTSDMITDMMAPSMEMTSVDSPTLGSELNITVADDGTVMVNDATVVTADIIASNGVIHVIDTVLVPPEIAEMVGDMMMQDDMGDMEATEEMMDDDMAMDDMMMDLSLFGTLNPADLENDAVVGLAGDLSAITSTFDGFEGITSVESIDFDSSGTAYITVDQADSAGSILVVDGLAGADAMAVGAGSRLIGGTTNAGLVSPKGIEVIESLGVVLVANFGASNIKGFPLDAEGDAAPTIFISDLGNATGSIWDILYVDMTDTLYAAGTAGDIIAYDNFSENLGTAGARVVSPANADGEKVTINLHGLAFVPEVDTLIVTDVGDAGDATDGHIYAVPGITDAEGNTTVNLHILGSESMLGNPVDIAWDGSGLYIAEKANSAFLYFANLLDTSGMTDLAPSLVLEAPNPESLVLFDGEMMMGDMAMEDDMGDDMMMEETIVDIAAGNEDFSTLVTAVQAAGLVDVLADPEAEWTVFAPTNAAFDALPEGVLDMLLADTELLTRVLTYHVVQGSVTSDMITDMMAPSMEMTSVDSPTLGSELNITVADDGTVMVNDATVVTADIIASNGVIHVIDTVLVPPEIAEMLGN